MALKYNNLTSFTESVTVSLNQDFKNQSYGYLEYNVYEGINLVLKDCGDNISIEKDIPTIYGILHDSKKAFTLKVNQNIGTNTLVVNKIEVKQIKITSEELYIGNYWLQEEQEFNKVLFSLDFFDNWFTNGKYEKDTSMKTEILLGLEKFKLFEFLSKSYSGFRNKGINQDIYTRNTSYILEYDSKNSIIDIKEDIRQIQNFYTFLFSRVCPIKTIKLYNEGKNDYQVLFFNQLSLRTHREISISKIQKYRKIFEDIPNILNNWILNYDTYRPIIENYVYDVELKSLAENSFLSNARNLERLHKYKHNDELSIFKRLESLFEKVPEKLLNTDVISRIKDERITDSNSLAKSVKETRNFITHAEVKEKESHVILHGYQLVVTNKVLEMLVKYFILRKIGLDEEKNVDEIKNNSNFYILFSDE